MLADILRFNRETTAMQRADRVYAVTLGEYLDDGNFDPVPRLVSVADGRGRSGRCLCRTCSTFHCQRSCASATVTGSCRSWIGHSGDTVLGGARTYVQRIVAQLDDVRLSTPVRRVRRYATHVEIDTPVATAERFDQVVLHAIADQTLGLLADATRQESELLGSVRYQSNRVLLHTDPRLMPRRRRAWSAWNYLAARERGDLPVCVTYWINKLQPLPFAYAGTRDAESSLRPDAGFGDR